MLKHHIQKNLSLFSLTSHNSHPNRVHLIYTEYISSEQSTSDWTDIRWGFPNAQLFSSFFFYLLACFRSSTITKYLAPTPPLNNNNETPQTHTQKKDGVGDGGGGGGGGGGGDFIHIYTALILSCAIQNRLHLSREGNVTSV